MRTLKPIPHTDLKDNVSELIAASYAKRTRIKYQRDLKRLNDWLNGRKLMDETLSEYIAHLHDAGKSPRTCIGVTAAVNAAAKLTGEPSPVGPITRRTMAGVRREGRNRGPGQVDGLNWVQVEKLITVAEQKGRLRDLRNIALISVMSDGLLRVGEAISLRVEDVREAENGSGRVLIRHSKTDQEGHGVVLYLGASTIDRVQKWCQAAKIQDGMLFRSIRRGGRVTGSALTQRRVQTIVGQMAKEAGMKGRYCTHSLRIGSAQSLVERGASLPEVQQAGRWNSPGMVAHYVKGQVAARGAVARLKYGGDENSVL